MARIALCVQNHSVPEDPRVWREAKTLAAAGHDVVVVSPAPEGQRRDRLVLEGIEIHRYRAPYREGFVGLIMQSLVGLVSITFELLRLRAVGRIDVVHVANPPDTLFVCAAVLRPLGARFVYDQHDLCPELLAARSGPRPVLAAILTLLERCSYRSADVVLSPNESYREIALERGGCDPASVVVVRNGPDATAAEPPSSSAQGPPIVAFAGVMGPQDGVATLVDAAAILLDRRPGSFVLELMGRGSEVPRLQAQVRQLGISDAVRWLGWVPADQMRERLTSATVAASVDDDTAFTRRSTMIKVVDYLSLGIPAVISDLPENRVSAGEAALYFRPGDPHDLAKRIEELFDDAELRVRLARRGLDRARSLTWDHSADALLAAYDRLLHEAGDTADG